MRLRKHRKKSSDFFYKIYLKNISTIHLAHDHRGRQSAVALLSFAFFPGEEIAKPQIKIWQIFLHFLLNTFKLLYKSCESFEMFSNCAEKHSKRDVTTVFAYSNLNTLIDQ